jgi:TRAP-type C4-dicarboxylate transport system permease small subunit
MQKTLLFVDRVSTWVGQLFSWTIVLLTLHVTWEVFSRYALDAPRSWAFDAMIMLYGDAVHDGRCLYIVEKRPCARRRAVRFLRAAHASDARLAALHRRFSSPGVFALTYAGYYYAADSWRIPRRRTSPQKGRRSIRSRRSFRSPERSSSSGHRRDHPLRDLPQAGLWPSREQDVEEVDVEKLKQEVGRQGRGHPEARCLRHEGAQVKLRREQCSASGLWR